MNDRDIPKIDWQQFEKTMMKSFPFQADSFLQGDFGKSKDWIKEYMHKAVTNFFSNTGFANPGMVDIFSKTQDYRLFETHRNLFVQMPLSERAARDYKVSASRRMLRITLNDNTEEIALPSDIDPARTTAKVKDGTLEVRMPKLEEIEPYYNVAVRD